MSFSLSLNSSICCSKSPVSPFHLPWPPSATLHPGQIEDLLFLPLEKPSFRKAMPVKTLFILQGLPQSTCRGFKMAANFLFRLPFTGSSFPISIIGLVLWLVLINRMQQRWRGVTPKPESYKICRFHFYVLGMFHLRALLLCWESHMEETWGAPMNSFRWIPSQ